MSGNIIQRQKVIKKKLINAPVAIQDLRATAIRKAINFATQLKEKKFLEISEIVRVCTALGIERAYLRGCNDTISSEADIDKYLYRFNWGRPLPFQTSLSNIETNPFITSSNNILFLQCLTTDQIEFDKCERNTSMYLANTGTTLPLTAMIPKYRDAGNDSTFPWLPSMNCNMLVGNTSGQNCLTLTDVTSGLEKNQFDLNMLVTLNQNKFPYITPNEGFPYLKKVIPEPKEIMYVIDGDEVPGKAVLKNKMQLTGYVNISSGSPVDIQITNVDSSAITGITDANTSNTPSGNTSSTLETDTQTDPTGEGETTVSDDSQETISIVTNGSNNVIEAGDEITTPLNETFTATSDSFPEVTIDGTVYNNVYIHDELLKEYAGPAIKIKDPVTGIGTKFDDELGSGDYVYFQFDDSEFPTLMFTDGSTTVYCKGGFDKVKELSNNFTTSYEMNVIHNGIEYKMKPLSATGGNIDTSNNENIDYDFTLTVSSRVDIGNYSSTLFSSQSISDCSVIPYGTNKKKGTIASTNTLFESLEVGDVVTIDSETYKFESITEKTLIGAYKTSGADLTRKTSQTLTRGVKTTRATNDFVGGKLKGAIYIFKVSSVGGAASITLDPNYIGPDYNGPIYRLGFGIEGVGETNFTSDLSGGGAVQLLADASQRNSKTFRIPNPKHPQKIFYSDATSQNWLSTATTETWTKNTIDSVQDAVDDFHMTTVKRTDLSTYCPDTGKPTTLNSVFDQEIKGQLYFTGNTTNDIVTLETLVHKSHGFNQGDEIIFRTKKYNPTPSDDPYGLLIDPANHTELTDTEYDECGLKIPVFNVINSYRFQIQKTATSNTAGFFKKWDSNTTHYLTGTNGVELDYWLKYFKPVYFDGTTNANSIAITTPPTVSINVFSKVGTVNIGNFNYAQTETQTYTMGSTEINAAAASTGKGGTFTDGSGSTNHGVFALTLNDGLVAPPDLMESLLIRAGIITEI